MKAGIFYHGYYGSTAQYAQWLANDTGYPTFDLQKNNNELDPSDFDLLILGSSVRINKLTIRNWIKENWPKIREKKIIFFSVSGTAPGHPDLEKYLADSLPQEMIDRMDYIPLRGRLIVKELSWGIRLLLWFGSLVEKDPEAKQRMRTGFDFVDEQNIKPLIRAIATHTVSS